MAGEVVQIHSATALTAMTEAELVTVLQTSLYPGANINSIKMVIGYCKAANLDPMQKPVHIVPMWDKNAKQMRDVIMPGVGLYRTQAARSNALAGISEPEFGPMVDIQLDSMSYKVPESCRVVVRRLLANGVVGEFAAVEYWIENYATAGKDSLQPNAMWKKRPRGQLAKCAQAQALRMAFPEMTGSAPTADEMEGKSFEAEIDITPKTSQPAIEAAKEVAKEVHFPDCTPEIFAEKKTGWRQTVQSGKKTADDLLKMLSTRATFTDAQRKEILSWDVPADQPDPDDEFVAAMDAAGDYVPQ